jgi:hypothetical protein
MSSSESDSEKDTRVVTTTWEDLEPFRTLGGSDSEEGEYSEEEEDGLLLDSQGQIQSTLIPTEVGSQQDAVQVPNIYGAAIGAAIARNLADEGSLRAKLHQSWQLAALAHYFSLVRRSFQLRAHVSCGSLAEWVLFPAGRDDQHPCAATELNELMWKLLHRRSEVRVGLKRCIRKYPLGWTLLLQQRVAEYYSFSWPLDPLAHGVSFFELHWKDRLNILYCVVHWLMDTDVFLQQKVIGSDVPLRALPIGFDAEGNVYWYFGNFKDAYVFLHRPAVYVEHGKRDVSRRMGMRLKVYDERVLAAARERRAADTRMDVDVDVGGAGAGSEEVAQPLEWSDSEAEFAQMRQVEQDRREMAAAEAVVAEKERKATEAKAASAIQSPATADAASSSSSSSKIAALGLDSTLVVSGKRKRKSTKTFSAQYSPQKHPRKNYPDFTLNHLLTHTGWNVACTTLSEMKTLFQALRKTHDEDQKALAEQMRLVLYPNILENEALLEKSRLREINRAEKLKQKLASRVNRPKSSRVQALHDKKIEEERQAKEKAQQEKERRRELARLEQEKQQQEEQDRRRVLQQAMTSSLRQRQKQTVQVQLEQQQKLNSREQEAVSVPTEIVVNEVEVDGPRHA